MNLLTFYFLHYELKYEIKYILNIALYLSGTILFFKNIKPFKFKNIYFSIFPITMILFGLFYLFGGILLALFGGTLIKPLYPTFSEYRKDGIILYPEYKGFLARCCLYKVNEDHGVFEKNLGTILLDMDSSPPNAIIELVDTQTVKVTYKDFENRQKTELLKLEN